MYTSGAVECGSFKVSWYLTGCNMKEASIAECSPINAIAADNICYAWAQGIGGWHTACSWLTECKSAVQVQKSSKPWVSCWIYHMIRKVFKNVTFKKQIWPKKLQYTISFPINLFYFYSVWFPTQQDSEIHHVPLWHSLCTVDSQLSICYLSALQIIRTTSLLIAASHNDMLPLHLSVMFYSDLQ